MLAVVADGEGHAIADLDLAELERRPRARSRRSPAAAPTHTVGREEVERGCLTSAKAPPVDKRRAILDAAVRVFARQGYHATRVADIADEAGVAYGLVYHYFRSKEAVMTELFTERWSLLLAAATSSTSSDIPAREKLAGIARFIIDSYRHDPELMKVIIIEVTRAANSFGATHLPEIRRAYDVVARIVADGQREGLYRRRDRPRLRRDVVLRGDRAAALRLGLRADPARPTRSSSGRR